MNVCPPKHALCPPLRRAPLKSEGAL